MTAAQERNITAVLDAVRDTGKSAHPTPGQSVSDVVMAVAITRGLNPVELQREIRAYAAEVGA